MKKLGIIVDSYSNMTLEQASEMHFGYISQSVILDEKVFRDGIDIKISNLEDAKKVQNAKVVQTSTPSPAQVEDVIQTFKKEYESIFIFPMHKGISSTFGNIQQVAKNFEDVYVIDHKLIGGATIAAAKEAQRQAEEGTSIDKILKWIDEFKTRSFCFLIPKDLKSMIRGGRLKGIKKLVLEKAKLIPRLYLGDNGVELKGLKRNFQKSIISAFEDLISFAGGKNKLQEYEFEIIHFGDNESRKLSIDIAKEMQITCQVTHGCATTLVHTGIGALGINLWKKVN